MNNMVNIYNKIPFARDPRAIVESHIEYINTISNLVESVLYSIDQAVKQNKTYTHFTIGHTYYEDVKKLFIAKGYTFQPTGAYDNNWEVVENICW